MNLIDALRTGKPLRLPLAKHKGLTRSEYLGREYVIQYLVSASSATIFPELHTNCLINEFDLMSDEWEVKND